MSTLVLLVGTNPLPNYVVAKYLIKKAGKILDKILLIHTGGTKKQGTRKQAERLQKF